MVCIHLDIPNGHLHQHLAEKTEKGICLNAFLFVLYVYDYSCSVYDDHTGLTECTYKMVPHCYNNDIR